MQDHDPGKRARSIEAGLTASRLSLVWTIASGLAAITIGVVGGSLVLAAFGSIGLLDGVGSAALVVHFRHAARLERISESSERITLLVVAFGMAVVGLVTTGESIHQLVERVRVGSLPEGIALAAVSAVILSILAVSKRRIGRRIPSRTLLADSWLSATGAALALISVAGTGLTATFGYWWADAAAAALVAAGAVAVTIGLAREELNLDREAGLKTGPNRRAPETTRGVNRSQALVLAFFAVVVIALFTMRVVAPAVYSDALALPLGGSPRGAELLRRGRGGLRGSHFGWSRLALALDVLADRGRVRRGHLAPSRLDIRGQRRPSLHGAGVVSGAAGGDRLGAVRHRARPDQRLSKGRPVGRLLIVIATSYEEAP